MQWMDARQSQWETRYQQQQEKLMGDIAKHESTIARLSDQVFCELGVVVGGTTPNHTTPGQHTHARTHTRTRARTHTSTHGRMHTRKQTPR